MRSGLLFCVAFACTLTAAHGQEAIRALSAEGQEALRLLRLEKLERATDSVQLNALTKDRLLGTRNVELLQATLRDNSKLSNNRQLDAAVRARLAMLEVSRLATADAGVAESLRILGVDPDQLRITATNTPDPVGAKNMLGRRLGVTAAGQLLVRDERVLITKPEPIADDRLPPGQFAPGAFLSPTPPVWRTGLRFAALIALRRGTTNTALCSGTVVDRSWVITAAHCLLDSSKGSKIELSTLVVFLPFQGGSETVAGSHGSVSRQMRRVRVSTASWIGDDTNDTFPTKLSGFAPFIQQGKDLAILQLDPSDLAALQSPIANVMLFSGVPAVPPVSMVGYGVTEQAPDGNLTLLVGLRQVPPSGLDRGEALLVYGANKLSGEGGFCGGDSGGGLFAGRMDGTTSEPRLIGVISALTGNEAATSADVCMVSQQNHTSLVVKRNRDFICKRVPKVCA